MAGRNTFGTSPVGRPATVKRSSRIRKELLQTIGEFLELEPSVAEMQMIDTIISCFMWSHRGYLTVYDSAVECHRVIHKEVPKWKKRKP